MTIAIAVKMPMIVSVRVVLLVHVIAIRVLAIVVIVIVILLTVIVVIVVVTVVVVAAAVVVGGGVIAVVVVVIDVVVGVVRIVVVIVAVRTSGCSQGPRKQLWPQCARLWCSPKAGSPALDGRD